MDTYDRDPRIVRLPLGASPTPTILICIAYLIFVKILGPAWMKDKKPYNPKGLLIFYNFTLVIANAWMFYKYGKHGWFWRYSWTCANVDYLETEDSLAIVEVSWYFFMSKLIEMADTVFFVLRKKDSQITFLHVGHHAFVPLLLWYGGGVGVSGFNTLFGFINSFVHSWMYLYYGLAALGPSIQKYLWWKKYLTSLQIFQFCILTLATISVIVTPGCKMPTRVLVFNLIPYLIFLALFLNFYRNAYKAKRKTKSSENCASFKLSVRNSVNLNCGSCKQNNKPTHND